MSKQVPGVPALLVNRTNAAAMLGVEAVTVDRWTATGALPVVKVPGTGKAGRPRNMYAVADLKRFIEAHTTTMQHPSAAPIPRPCRRAASSAADLPHSSAAAILSMGKAGER
ncbi:helix-turn-helix domain-containing protein [Bifidobacterium miconisargentati]|uniref:helix-turn-helix domain-containing protein n=1 Tax=Bifidobacterium miconisargentati TaxID=2834437 RepID=UPI001BDD1A54|nr:helix-turn-helix domain-containing protein [Bifidobacterium miconisargentati]MBW3091089.1 helix-turn-helix domain-containing protein [Bifidobacterium miconisargentati]